MKAHSVSLPGAAWFIVCLHVSSAGGHRRPDDSVSITHVSPCEDKLQHRSSLCVNVEFNANFSDVASVACQKYDKPPHRTPKFKEVLFGLGNQDCRPNSLCHVTLFGHDLPPNMHLKPTSLESKSVIKPDTTYYIFCAGWSKVERDGDDDYADMIRVWPTCAAHSQSSCGVAVTSARATPHEDTFGIQDFAAVLLLIVYICWSFLFKYVRVLHETGFSVIAGVLLGVILETFWGHCVVFSYDTFSLFLLPMVIFAAGFNLQKKNFFRYSIYIMTLGVTGTVLIFVSIYFGSLVWDFRAHDGSKISLTPRDRLVMASVLASTDSVAPMAFLPAEQFPRIFAVVFGEGVLNDVVSILLSTATASSSTLPSFGELTGQITFFFATSSMMGLIFGFSISYFFKIVEPLRKETIRPVTLIYLMNYLCYVLTELFGFSSIFALFLCALLCGHYAKYSLSHEAREFAKEFAETLSYSAEAFVFGYFGLTAVTYLRDPSSFSLPLIFFYVLVVVVVRFVSVAWLAAGLRVLRCGQKLSLDRRELCVIALAGCMRGTIAYALILRAMPDDSLQTPKDTILVTTVLGIVLVNCLVFGGLFPIVLRCLGISGGMQPASMQPGGTVEDTVCDLPTMHSCPGPSRTHSAQDPEIGSRRVSLESLMVDPAQVREHVHGCWHRLDDRFLKPVFRPPSDDGDHSGYGGELSFSQEVNPRTS